MSSKLIALEDGVLVEVEVPEEEAQRISGGVADKVSASFNSIKPVLLSTYKPIVDVWQELSKEMEVESAEIELGIGFEGEGNIYITKSKLAANLTVKFTLKPKS